MEKVRSKTYVYSGRDYRYLPMVFFMIFIMILIFNWILTMIVYPESFRIKNIYDKTLLIIVFILVIFVMILYLRFRFLKREIKINNWGIEFRVGKKIEFEFPWKEIKLIETGTAGMGWEAINIYDFKNKFPSKIHHMHPKELKPALKKIAEYARKYNIEIDDHFGYLKKPTTESQRTQRK